MSNTTYSIQRQSVKLPRRIHSGFWPEGHVQGIAVDLMGGAVYYSFTTILLKTDLFGNPLGSVRGIVGHLGCITLDAARRRVYGTLELKHDAIGAGIVARTGQALAEEDAFYLVSFDIDRINRMDMEAEADGVMQAVYLPDVVADFRATDEISGAHHRYGCSGIDGTALGPAPGERADAPAKILIAYGIYSDVGRADNDHQVLLQYDPSVIDRYGAPLAQQAPHHSGCAAERRYFFHTGNTTYGVQNLEYDPYTRTYMAAVYPGIKPAFVNHPFFLIDAKVPPANALLAGRGGETGLLLSPATNAHPTCDERGGCAFPWGSTGMAALGDGLYAFSHQLSRTEPDEGSVPHGRCTFASEVVFCRFSEGDDVFVEL